MIPSQVAGEKVPSLVQPSKPSPQPTITRHSLKDGGKVGGWSSMAGEHKATARRYADQRGFDIDENGTYRVKGSQEAGVPLSTWLFGQKVTFNEQHPQWNNLDSNERYTLTNILRNSGWDITSDGIIIKGYF